MFVRILIFLCAFALCYPAYAAAPADPGARIVVPSHDILRGEVVGESDLAYQIVAAASVFPGVVTSMDDLKGLEARRIVRAGEAVRLDDFRKPILVTKGSTVTMTFTAPGITVTAIGKAMSEGGMGELVTVQNPVSFRQVTAVVTGTGQVRAGSTTASISDSGRVAQIAP